jgi:hypothetical protein
MSYATPIVFVVDDDVSICESLEALIQFAGWEALARATTRPRPAHTFPVLARGALLTELAACRPHTMESGGPHARILQHVCAT